MQNMVCTSLLTAGIYMVMCLCQVPRCVSVAPFTDRCCFDCVQVRLEEEVRSLTARLERANQLVPKFAALQEEYNGLMNENHRWYVTCVFTHACDCRAVCVQGYVDVFTQTRYVDVCCERQVALRQRTVS